MSVIEQGWSWPPASKKAHYFLRGRLNSLCAKWAYTGGEREDTAHDSPDNCAECKKRRAAREAKT